MPTRIFLKMLISKFFALTITRGDDKAVPTLCLQYSDFMLIEEMWHIPSLNTAWDRDQIIAFDVKTI